MAGDVAPTGRSLFPSDGFRVDVHLDPAGATEVDSLYFFLVGLSAVLSLLIASLVVFFAIRFRRRHADEVGAQVHGGLLLEVQWLYLFGALAVALIGAGRYSLGGAQGRWN